MPLSTEIPTAPRSVGLCNIESMIKIQLSILDKEVASPQIVVRVSPDVGSEFLLDVTRHNLATPRQ